MTPLQWVAVAAGAAALAFLGLTCTGCEAFTALPGQTPAQVQACSTDLSAHNWLAGASGVIGGTAATQAGVAALESPGPAHTLAISGAITGGVAAGLLLAAEYFGAASTSSGCTVPTFAIDAGDGGT